MADDCFRRQGDVENDRRFIRPRPLQRCKLAVEEGDGGEMSLPGLEPRRNEVTRPPSRKMNWSTPSLSRMRSRYRRFSAEQATTTGREGASDAAWQTACVSACKIDPISGVIGVQF